MITPIATGTATWVALSPAFALTLGDPDPGRVGRDNVFQVSGATPGASVVVVGGGVGSTSVPRCPGLSLDIRRQWVSDVAISDATGSARIVARMPVALAGQPSGFQAVEPASCTVSPLVPWTWPSPRIVRGHQADGMAIGGDDYDYLGRSLSGAGDLDGDGLDDVVIGVPGLLGGPPGAGRGGAIIVRGPFVGEQAAGAGVIAALHADESEGGFSVAGLGDMDGDGLPEIAVAEQPLGDWNGAVYLVSAPFMGRDLLRDVATGTVLDPELVYFHGVKAAGDVNGDGFSDVWIAGRLDTEIDYFLYQGPVLGNVTPADADGVISLGILGLDASSIDGNGDIDGDGISDAVVGVENGIQADRPDALIYYGPSGASIHPEADAVLRGSIWGAIDASIVGDVDADGYDDVMVAGTRFGDKVHLILGRPMAGVVDLDAAAAATLQDEGDDYAIGRIEDAGDTNQDGHADVVLGTYSVFADRAYVVLGPPRGAMKLAAADIRLRGGGSFGWSVSGAGDVNGDGYDDVLVGAPNKDYFDFYNFDSAGYAYLFQGRPDL